MTEHELWKEIKKRLGDLCPNMFLGIDHDENMDEIRIHTGLMARHRFDAEDNEIDRHGNPVADDDNLDVEAWEPEGGWTEETDE